MMAIEVISKYRAPGWCLVTALAGFAAVGLSRSPDWSASAVGLAILFGLVGGLVVEAAMLVLEQIYDSAKQVSLPPGARPADGLVEILSMSGVSSVGLPETPWRRFERVDPPPPKRGRTLISPNGADPALLGQVALVSVFVGRNGQAWSDREIRNAHESLQSVARWVEREAEGWSSHVNVGLAETFFQVEDDHDAAVELDFVPEGTDFGPMEANSTTKSMAQASRVASLLGFRDVADLIDQINRRVSADVAVWLFHVRSQGRSHAIPTGDRVVEGVGLAICFARESSFPEPLIGPGRVDPATVAHEMMHLFGASDKYGTELSEYPRQSVGRRDIMRLDEGRLDRLRVGGLTAVEVGWRRNY